MGESLTGKKRKDTYTWLLQMQGNGTTLDAETPTTLCFGDGTETPLAITTTGLFVGGVRLVSSTWGTDSVAVTPTAGVVTFLPEWLNHVINISLDTEDASMNFPDAADGGRFAVNIIGGFSLLYLGAFTPLGVAFSTMTAAHGLCVFTALNGAWFVEKEFSLPPPQVPYDLGNIGWEAGLAMDLANGPEQYGSDVSNFNLLPPTGGNASQPATIALTFNTNGDAEAVTFDSSIQGTGGDVLILAPNMAYRIELHRKGWLWCLTNIYGPSPID